MSDFAVRVAGRLAGDLVSEKLLSWIAGGGGTVPTEKRSHGEPDRASGWSFGSAVGSFPTVEALQEPMDDVQASVPFKKASGKWRRLSVAPGRVKRSEHTWVEAPSPRTGGSYWRRLAAVTVDLGSDVDARAERATRGRVLKWTPRSRNRMIDKLRTLDYRPLFENGGHPAMVTLTMVGRSEAHGDHTWIEVAPDGEAYARMIELLQGRFWKSWGYRMPGVWKREFQERGAPHTHILMTPPRGRSRGDGMEFPLWLSMHWASIQRYQGQTPEEFAKTVANSTSIDYDKGLRGYDAARVTQYFGKHGAWAAKDYQNNPPKAWQERNKVGRFWGYWQLRPIEGVAMFGPAEEAASPQRWWGKGKSVPESPIMHIMSTSRRHLRV